MFRLLRNVFCMRFILNIIRTYWVDYSSNNLSRFCWNIYETKCLMIKSKMFDLEPRVYGKYPIIGDVQ